MTSLLMFRGLFFRRWRGLALALALSLVAVASGVALLGTSGWFITAAALTTAGLSFNLFVPSALVRTFSFVRILSRYGERLVGHDATLRLLADLRGWLFARLFPRMPLPNRSLRHGDLVSRLTADVDALDNAFLVAIGPISAATIIGISLTILLAWLLPGAAVIYSLCFAAATIVVPIGLVLLARENGKQAVARAADARADVLDGVEGHLDFAAMGVLKTMQNYFMDSAKLLAQARGQLATHTAWAGFSVQALAGFAFAESLWSGLAAHGAGQIDGPVLAGLLLAIAGSFEATGVIVRSAARLTAAMAAAERLTLIAGTPPSVTDPRSPKPLDSDVTIEVDDVSFSYPGGAPVLNGVDLVIAAGTHIAITGPSGSGKSSLLSLLLRLADPQLGEIRLGGIALPELSQADVHRTIALLGQDSPLFHDTIRANLLIGRADADEDALWNALGDAAIADFVRNLPKGLDTLIGEGGRNVSAGQARRLCLARTLLSPAQVLLMDEPTTGLDREAEMAFFATLRHAAQGRTVIIVTHATVPRHCVDKVVSMRGGRLLSAA